MTNNYYPPKCELLLRVWNFLEDSWRRLPKPAQVVSYFIILLMLIYILLLLFTPTPRAVTGWFHLYDKNEKVLRLENDRAYRIRHGQNTFTIGSDGFWSISVDALVPQPILIEIVDIGGAPIAKREIWLPLHNILWRPFRLKMVEGTGTLLEGTGTAYTTQLSDQPFSPWHAYASGALIGATPSASGSKCIGFIKMIRIAEGGDSKSSTAELYFKISIDGKEPNHTLPTKGATANHIVLNDNSTAAFESRLAFTIPLSQTGGGSKMNIKLYDYDLFSRDELIGDFDINLPLMQGTSHFDTKPLGRFSKTAIEIEMPNQC